MEIINFCFEISKRPIAPFLQLLHALFYWSGSAAACGTVTLPSDTYRTYRGRLDRPKRSSHQRKKYHRRHQQEAHELLHPLQPHPLASASKRSTSERLVETRSAKRAQGPSHQTSVTPEKKWRHGKMGTDNGVISLCLLLVAERQSSVT
jgi:hypothetical protein